MQFTPDTQRDLFGHFLSGLRGGLVAIYAGSPPRTPFQVPLVTVPVDGYVLTSPTAAEVSTATGVIAHSGTAGWAALLTLSGDVKAILTVTDDQDPQADQRDMVLNRLELHYGGILTLSPITVRVRFPES